GSQVAVCLDRSAAAAEGLAEARRLCREGCRLRLVHVVAGRGGGAEPEWLGAAAARTGGEPVTLRGRPAERVLEWAWEARPDLLVAASHAGRVERVLGSFVRRVAVGGPCPA